MGITEAYSLSPRDRTWLNHSTICLLFSLIVSFASFGPIDAHFKILGGVEITIDEIPFQLALEGSGRQLCGASALSTDWALTAAHCVFRKPAVWLQFRAGSHELLKGGTIHPVKYYLIHENYNESLTYDVAVVKVTEPFIFDGSLQPVKLPTSVPVPEEFTFVSGWGFQEKERVNKAKQLMFIYLYVKKWEDCKDKYRHQLTESMLCAGSNESEKDTCNGDSGGPLLRPGGEQVGIVSWGYGCGYGLPSVYTNVSVVTPWIQNITNVQIQSFNDDIPSHEIKKNVPENDTNSEIQSISFRLP